LTYGRGANYVFVVVGNPEVVNPALSMTSARGTLVIVGVVVSPVSIPMLYFLQERKLTGSTMGSTNLGVDIPRLVALYQAGRIKLDELITGRYPLEQINEAIDSMERGEALRNVVVF